MNAADIQAARQVLAAIDGEVSTARDACAKFRTNCNPFLITTWSLDSPPGHLPTADVERLRLLANTVEVAERCQAAAQRLLDTLTSEAA